MVLDMAGAKREDIRIVDQSTVKEIGDRFEIEWQLSANPNLNGPRSFSWQSRQTAMARSIGWRVVVLM